ncbi:toprim domain-containing protein [uncultured Polaribacter sp.]|uniref:toprim domain-containing protein n=1 Tax=uncultured Polaribacter sp. TaxID=174711 RepID=UPI002622F4FA|nr:toprim domain-containing protein [uncultured Polaribacter sp.]
MKEKNMNCKKANKIDLVLYLKKQGYKPIKNTPTSVWFLSPFRNEKTPSFRVNLMKNIWFDFGEGSGGSVIDFIIKLNNCSAKYALEILSKDNFFFHEQKENKLILSKPKYSITKVTELSNLNLIQYLNSRKINIEFAKKFLCQVHYSFKPKKEFYGIGFMNDFGGYEIRNIYFKGCLGKKMITTINNNSNTISLFESWSDFLSYLTLKNNIPDENFIILNSTSLIKKVIESIDKFSQVKCFLDNDEAGNKAFDFLNKNSKCIITDYRKHYKNYKDLNELLKG